MLTYPLMGSPPSPDDDRAAEAQEMQSLVDAIFARFDEMGIPYCLLRNRAKIPDGLLGWSDLDILVPSTTAVDELIRLFAAFHPVQVGPFRHRRMMLYLPVKHMYLLLDISCGMLDWHGITYLDDTEVLARRRDDGGIVVAAPIHQAFNVWFAKLLWRSEVPERYASMIATAVRSEPETFHRLAARAFGEPLATTLLDLGLTDRVVESRILAGRCRRALSMHAFHRHPVKTLISIVDDRRYGLERLISPAGLEVALLGPDGVGKSSVASGIRNAPSRPAGVKTVDHHKTYRPVLPRLSTLARRVMHRPLPSRRNARDPHGAPSLHPLVWLARYGYYTIDQWLSYVGVRRSLASGHLVIKDRHWLEFSVDPQRYRYAGPMVIPRLLSRLVPQPDVVIVLDAPTDVIHSRKQELSAQDIELLREGYRRLLANVHNGYLVRSDQSPDAVAGEVLAIINGFIQQRTLRRFPRANP